MQWLIESAKQRWKILAGIGGVWLAAEIGVALAIVWGIRQGM